MLTKILSRSLTSIKKMDFAKLTLTGKNENTIPFPLAIRIRNELNGGIYVSSKNSSQVIWQTTTKMAENCHYFLLFISTDALFYSSINPLQRRSPRSE
jgi:hypothetical protein